MSLIVLDLPSQGSGTAPMINAAKTSFKSSLTTTQLGAIGESLTAAQLMLTSGGRLSPFLPLADDGGLDLIVFDKVTGKSAPIQVKSRTGPDAGGKWVEFSVRLKTFTPLNGGYLLGLLLDQERLTCGWLIPMTELEAVSTRSKDVLKISPSPKPDSRDRYVSYRHQSFAEIAQRLIADLSA